MSLVDFIFAELVSFAKETRGGALALDGRSARGDRASGDEGPRAGENWLKAENTFD
jgi:hypothetical protein